MAVNVKPPVTAEWFSDGVCYWKVDGDSVVRIGMIGGNGCEG